MEFVPYAKISLGNSKKRIGLNCFIKLESVLPTSSTRVDANQNITIAWLSGIFCIIVCISGALSRDSYGAADLMYTQYMRCFTQFFQDEENWKKYATRVEQSFLMTSGPSESSTHRISQSRRVQSSAWTSSSPRDFLLGKLTKLS
jgi:hypothetical protein